MADKTENPATIYAMPGSPIYTDKTVKNTVEYIRADLLNNEDWLAARGLKTFCNLCNDTGKIPIFEKQGSGKMYLIGYEPCECIVIIKGE